LFIRMGQGVLLAFLAAQDGIPAVDPLQEEWNRAQTGARDWIATVIAVHVDGTPVRGYIRCAGWWRRHIDEETMEGGESFPFKTDSRGAVGFNPHIEDEWIHCWASDKGMTGEVTIFQSRPVQRLVLNKKGR
jgi:hypothetical protein